MQDEGPIDWSFEGRQGAILHKVKAPNSNFRRCILEDADLSESNFEDSDFRKAAMRGANMMKTAFDNCDFRGTDLKKARMNISVYRNCKFTGADLRGIRGKHAIWEGSDWWNAKLDEDLEKVLAKKWPKPSEE